MNATNAKAKQQTGASKSSNNREFPVVCIGASAGGVDALKDFFSHLEADTGLAFVVILHLSRDHESNLPELLAKQTAMQVNSAAETQQLAPNQVFVIPARYVLSLKGRTLQLAEREQGPGQFKPIDHFLESLAEQLEERAISVILSGTGADGTVGTTAVKSVGGITFAQSENSAKFAEMPRNAARSGHVDLVLPEIVAGKEDDEPIRIWVPGCATGEEVYSLAMVLAEFLSDQKTYLSVQLFGTDVSEGAIEKARQGIYLESRLAGVSESRRSKFFTPSDGGFQVKKHLREMCVFARQDFISDPPFSRLDLISCRNVLIYFGNSLQKKVLPLFHYALNANGYLLLGGSENIGQAVAEEPAEEKSESALGKDNRRLQEELTRNQAYAQQLAEEKDEAVEDLKAANEEILSSNEELQSINEEIETAKEELESSNEELTTVNQELQHRNEELAQAHNDLSNLISSVQIPFVIVRDNLKIRRVSDNAEELLQITPGDVGRALTDLTLSFEFPDLEQSLREVIDSGKEFEREIQDRKSRWNLLRVRPYRTEKGADIQGAVLALFDIDRLKRSMEEVKKAYKYSLQIVDTIKDPLLVLDEKLCVKKANPAFYQKFQVSPRQIEGAEVYSLGSGQWDQADLRRLLEEILPQSSQMDNYLLEFDFPHLGPRAMVLSARQMQGGTVSPKSILLAIRDVTEQKQSEEFLRRAKQAAEEASRAKSEFLANISHEIRTPITVILSAVQYLRDTELGPEQSRCAEMAEKSTGSLLELLDDILDFSRIEVDKVDIRPAPFDLRENVADTVDILRREAVRKELQLDLQIADDLPQTVLSDWKRLRQVLVNLIGNAIKFTEEGKVEVRVEKAAAAEKGDKLLFAVRDTGIGIAEENLDQLFLTFTQLDSSTTRQYGGTGLGLAICKGLVERLGGAIWVESRLGKGSTFFFTLPLKDAAKTARSGPGDQDKALPPAATREPLPAARILLGEDDRDIRTLVAMILKDWGLEVVEAETGAEVVAKCRAEQPDVVLMDLQMPEMDGLEATRTIRGLKTGGDGKPRIVAFTAHANRKDHDRCLKAGMDAVVTKPIDRDELFAVLQGFLEE